MAVSARQVTRVAADILCLAAVGIPILLLKYLAQPNIQGFFCSDDSLRYPYFDSTIPTKVNVSVSYGIPTVLIIIVNLSQTCLNKSSLSSVIRTIYQDITFFLFGVFTVQLLSGVCKLTAGRLRPHFMTVCQPGLVECGTWASPSYVTNYTCVGDSQLFPDEDVRNHRVREARLSFLSGHASLANYSMMYSIMFIQTRTRSSQAFRLVRGLLQAVLLLYAVVVSLSRVSDNKHHPTDVIAGAVLGAALALGVTHVAARLGVKYSNGEQAAIDRRGAAEMEFKVP